MKAATLVLALLLATNAAGALAVPADGAMDDGSMSATPAREWFQTGTFEQQDEAQKAKLDREGFPQYNN